MSAPDLDRLRRVLQRSPFCTEIRVLDETGSTNDDALEMAAGGAPEGTVVAAGAQRAGRGRRGNRWYSPAGGGLYLSVVFRPRRPVTELVRWTLAAAVAACDACRTVAGCPAWIKWPNDVLCREGKLAGTLAEARSGDPDGGILVVGTGINVEMDPASLPPDLAGRAAALRSIARGSVDVVALAREYVRGLAAWTGFLSRGRWEPVAEAWSARAPGASGARVRVLPPGHEDRAFDGITRGLAGDGSLRVQAGDGRVVSVHLGESVVPLGG